MTRLTGPGTGFLRVARRIFPAAIVDRVFLPAVADLHAEWRESHGRFERARVRVRGAISLIVLALLTPLDVTTPRHAASRMPGRRFGSGWILVLFTLLFYAATWPFFGAFAATTALFGMAVAFGVHAWNARHMANAIEAQQPAHAPIAEINLSAIPVGGDIAGLIFAAGSVAIVVIGLPNMWWYLVGMVAAGLLVAASLVAWHSAHPESHRAVLLDR